MYDFFKIQLCWIRSNEFRWNINDRKKKPLTSTPNKPHAKYGTQQRVL